MINKLLIVSCLLIFSISPTVAQHTLIINEFLASSDTCCDDGLGGFEDFIEIYNPGEEAVDIGGIYVTDALSSPTKWQIPTNAPAVTTIPARGFLVLWADKDTGQGPLHVNLKLSSGGEAIGLFESDGTTVIDTLRFDAQDTDISYGRVPDGSDIWAFFTNPTPGASNGYASVVINEFLASNDSGLTDEFGGHDDWIELYNTGSHQVDVGGMYITDNLAEPNLWQIPASAPDSTTIASGEFLLLWCDKEPEQGILHVKLKLSGSGEQIGLFATDGVTLIDTLSYGEQTTDVSYGRNPDGSNFWELFAAPTPGATNGGMTSVRDNPREDNVLPDYNLSQNYPNPFNPATHISYRISEPANVKIAVYNTVGKEIKTLINGPKAAGDFSIQWNGIDNNNEQVASGIYFFRIETEKFNQTKKMILVR